MGLKGLCLLCIAVLSHVALGQDCSSSSDCNLLGDCVNGECQCDPYFSGSPDCSVMAFELLNKTMQPGYYPANASSWGGYPIEDKHTNKHHLFFAQMANHCGLGTWKTNSMVARAVSLTGRPEGPYQFEKTVLPHFAHNPTIRQANDGTFVIYFIGGWNTSAQDCKSPGQQDIIEFVVGHTDAHPPLPARCNGQNWPKTCGADMPGPMGDCCGPGTASWEANAGCGIAMASSKSLEGPWEVTSLVIENQWESDEVYCTHTNPSPVFLPNGTVVLAFNAGFCNKQLETIGIASAPSWRGPYTLLNKNAVLRNPDGTPHHCEDPFLWRTSRGWHLLTHNQQAPQGESSYGFSPDGVSWTLSPRTPYNCTVRFHDGTTEDVVGCGNRPQIVFGEGGVPEWIVNGATAAKPGRHDGTWTVFRKLQA